MRTHGMDRFWDARAAEDALFFVDTRHPYRDADLQAFWASGPADLDALLGQLGTALRPSDDVVEIGCGVGRLTRAISERASTVRALDVSPEMLARARGLNPGLEGVEWIVGDGSSLAGIGDGSADACISYVVFQHLPDPELTLGYIREMGRVLRPGGWAAFQLSNDPDVHRGPGALGRARAALGALTGRSPRGQAHPAWRGSAVELDAVRGAASDGGMTVERVLHEQTQYCTVLARAQAPGETATA